MYIEKYFKGAESWGPLAWIIFGFLVFILLVWTLFWKYKALWKAARQGDKLWFVILLVVNTVGILEILYVYKFSKKN